MGDVLDIPDRPEAEETAEEQVRTGLRLHSCSLAAAG